MNDEDLRDFFAGLSLVGLVMRGESVLDSGYLAYKYADSVIDAKYKVEEDGIATIKKRAKKATL